MDKEYIIKRLKSFGWNMLSVFAVSALTLIVDPEFAQSIGLGGIYLVILKEVLAQMTKYFNK